MFGYCFQLDQVVLTCFKNNPAMGFYQRLGFVYHEGSPINHGYNCNYEILAKECEIADSEEEEEES